MNFDESKAAGPHTKLASLSGQWQGTATTWFEPGIVGDESPVQGTIRQVLDGRFVLHEYTGSMSGKPLEGLAIFGFDVNSGKYQSAWIDSFHMSTGILFSEGDAGDNHSVLGHYASGGPGSEQWGWRTEIEILDDNSIVLTAFNISPDGDEAKATETRYSRVV